MTIWQNLQDVFIIALDGGIRGLIGFAIALPLSFWLRNQLHLSIPLILGITFFVIIIFSSLMAKFVKVNFGYWLVIRYMQWLNSLMGKESE